MVKGKFAHQKVSIYYEHISRLIRICRTQWCSSLFSVLDQKYSFWVNLVQKNKIVRLSWNLIPRLNRICTIQWCCSLFPFSTCKFCSKNSFAVLTLPDQSPSHLLADTWSRWLFSIHNNNKYYKYSLTIKRITRHNIRLN